MTLIPGVFTSCNIEIIIGISAAARAVAEANPKWIIMRKAASTAKINSPEASANPKKGTKVFASHTPALVSIIAEPRLMPIPKRKRVPQANLC